MAEDTQVATGYKFFPVVDPAALRSEVETAALEIGVLGTVLIAPEGINLSVAGTSTQIDAVDTMLARILAPSQLHLQRSPAGEVRPFRRLRVRLRQEIVALGREDAPLHFDAATEASAEEWNRLLDDASVPVIDVRNHYEVAVGRFEGAVDPHTESFRQFPAWVEAHLDPDTTPEVAIYCTGGIRCTKAAAWMRGLGFKRVHELHGGILAYLAATPPEKSRWQGECFVFDDRVGLRKSARNSPVGDLEPGELTLCPDCGQPHWADADATVGASSPEPDVIHRHCRSRVQPIKETEA